MNSQEKVLSMMAEGRITSEEADELLKAMRTRRSMLWSGFLDPLDRLGTRGSVIAGVLAVLGGLLLSRTGVRFDGALDTHLSSQPVAWSTAFVDAAVAFPFTAIVMWLSARAFTKSVRFIDVLAAIGVSRVAVTFGAGVLRLLPQVGAGSPPAAMILVAVVALALVALQLTWLFRSFRTATGLKDGKLKAAFAVGLVTAEMAGVAIARGWLG